MLLCRFEKKKNKKFKRVCKDLFNKRYELYVYYNVFEIIKIYD